MNIPLSQHVDAVSAMSRQPSGASRGGARDMLTLDTCLHNTCLHAAVEK